MLYDSCTWYLNENELLMQKMIGVVMILMCEVRLVDRKLKNLISVGF